MPAWCANAELMSEVTTVESQAVYDITNIPLKIVEATFGDLSYLSTSTKFSLSLFKFFIKKKTAHKQIDGMVLFGVSLLWIIEYIFRHSSFFKQNPYWAPPLRYRAGSLLQSPTAPWPQRWRSRRGALITSAQWQQPFSAGALRAWHPAALSVTFQCFQSLPHPSVSHCHIAIYLAWIFTLRRKKLTQNCQKQSLALSLVRQVLWDGFNPSKRAVRWALN